MQDTNLIFDSEQAARGDDNAAWNVAENLSSADCARQTELTHRIEAARLVS